MQTYTLKVYQVKEETSDTITLCFKQPGLKKVKYKAGQYLTLIFRINGRRYIRPYSFSSAPEVDKHLEVTVKRVPEGVVSNHINDLIKVGDLIEAMPPMGDFILPERKHYTSVFLWAAGSGITPLFSIAKSVLITQPHVKVNLIYGNKSKETTIFHEQISSLIKQNLERFKVTHFHTQPKIDESLPHVVQGRLMPQKVVTVLEGTQLTDSLHFICGPIGLKESVKKVLEAHNIPSTNVFSEDFELIKDPKDFTEIDTQEITLKFEKEEHRLEVAKGKSILEVSLDAGLELPYSCQTGNCSTCKGVLKQGNLKMIGLTGDRKDLAQNEFLLCCSYPLTSDVYVEI